MNSPAIEVLWEAFNDIADGFGVSSAEFKEIFSELCEDLDLKRERMDILAGNLFRLFDTDHNELIDAMEFLGTLAMASGMSNREALEFVLNCYDFDGTQHLTIDEITLAMKSTLTGLCKLTGEKMPREQELEMVAIHAFESNGSEKNRSKIPILDMIDFCTEDPDTKSWISYFDDAQQEQVEVYEALSHDIDNHLEAQPVQRTVFETAASEQDVLAFDGLPSDKVLKSQRWFLAVESLVPSSVAQLKPSIRAQVPDAQLELEWVHGYRSDDVRNNLFYTSKGDAVYHAGRLGIVLHCLNRQQHYHMDHADDIMCLAMHPEGEFVATGEVGAFPRIMVWNAYTTRTLHILRGFHRVGIIQLAFSANGSQLVSIGSDEYYSIALYDWQKEELLFSSKNTLARVFACCFMEGGMLVSAGEDHINFWVREAKTFVKRKGIFGRKGKQQSLLCLLPLRDRVLSGSTSGHLYVWAGRNCVKAIKAHYGSVNALCAGVACCVSGGKDHRVRLWTLRLEPGATFDLSSFGLLPSIRSLALSADSARILVGTKGGDIYEISAADGSDTQGGPLTTGHFQGCLWGLSCHPFKKEFATAGADMTVRVWDMDTCHPVKMTKLDSPATAIEYSIDGETLVVGLGLTNPQQKLRDNEPFDSESIKKEGGFVVMNESDLAIIYEAKDSTKPITDIKFSPSGEYVAVASADHGVYLYQAGDPFELIGKVRSHQAPVLHIDFSADSEWGRSTSSNKELFFFSSKKAEPMENIVALRDMTWASENCPYVWSTQGIFPPQLDGSEIFCCDKGGPSGKTLATGDSFGRLRLFRSPCLRVGAAYHEYRGHSGGIAKAYFAYDSSKLITIGSSDRCVFQWKYSDTVASDDEDAIVKEEIESDGCIADLRDGSDLDRGRQHEMVTKGTIDVRLELQLETVSDVELDEAVPLKPWRQFSAPPTAPPPSDLSVSTSALECEWVHGYRAHDCRNNLGYSAQGRLVYNVGTFGVSLEHDTHTQCFNSDHDDEVICLAVSSCRRFVATGQMGSRPLVIVWESETAKTLAKLQGFHRRAVSVVAFSQDSTTLACVGHDQDHTIALYNWRNEQTLITTGKGGPRKVMGLAFHSDGTKLIQCGLKHIYFWSWRGRHLSFTRGLISSQGALQTFPCCLFVGDTPVVGTSDGHLYCFESISVERSIKAHEKAVFALSLCEEGLCSGSKDGVIKMWNRRFETTRTFNLNELLGSPGGVEVRAVCVFESSRKLAVGIRKSEIYELNIDRGTLLQKEPVIQGHGKGEVWGLACNPNRAEYATTGDDCVLRIWDIVGRRPLKSLVMDVSSRAVAYSPSGMAIVVGLGGGEKKPHKKSGGFVIFQAGDLSMIHEAKDCQEWIRAIAYSPDGKTLALASQDTQIYLYNVTTAYSRKAVVSAHKASVCSLDFSADSQFIRSTDTAMQLCFSDASNGGHIQSVMPVRDVRWQTSTCPFGWEVSGLWEPARHASNGEEYLTVCRSSAANVIATGDNFGRIGLTRFPCVDPNAAVIFYRAHGPNVFRVQWSVADTHLLSVGGPDGAVVQWRHVVDAPLDSGDEGGQSGEDSELPHDGGLSHAGIEVSKDSKADHQGGLQKIKTDIEPAPIKNWVLAMVAPSQLTQEDSSKPNFRAKLDYVHGCRSEDVRNVVKYTCEDCLAYPAAGVGVVYKSRERKQEFYEGHKGDVVSFAITENGKVIATGEVKQRPQVAIWDSMTGIEIKKFPSAHLRAVSYLAFSQSGNMLASLGQDREHTVVVYRTPTGKWTDGSAAYHVKVGSWKVLFLLFAGQEDLPLMVGGVKKVLYFYPVSGGMYRKSGIFGRQKKIQPILCGVLRSAENDVVTGCVNGQLYIWSVLGRVTRTIRAHDGPVYCVSYYHKEGGVVTGGKDGMIKLWSRDFQILKQFNLLDATPEPFLPIVHSVCLNRVANKVAVATRGGEIYEVSKDSGRWLLLVESHSAHELHGLCTHPSDSTLYATAGDDQFVRVWSIPHRCCIRRVRIDSPIRSIAWSPDGEHLALGLGGLPTTGTKDGTLMILSAITLEILYEIRKSKIFLSDLKYSRDGARLVASSMDGKCFFHKTSDYSLETSTKPVEAGITTIDLSADGTKVQAATTDFNLMYYSCTDGTHLTANSTRDTVWGTGNCPYGWNVQGLWEHHGLPLELACVDRGKSKGITVSGYDDGVIRIHNYPAPVSGMNAVDVSGHGSKISRIRFSPLEDHIFSAGVFSRVICQRTVEPYKNQV